MLDKFLRQLVCLLEPIGLLWLCLIVLALWLFRRKQRDCALAVLALALLVFLIGGTGFPGALLGSLERPYVGLEPEKLPQADAVVMLGGGSEPSRYEAGRLHLTPAGDRFHMALEVLQLRKAPALVLGGGGAEFEDKFLAESELAAAWFDQLRKAGAIDPNTRIIPLKPCGDTHDEALGVRVLATANGWHRVLLVTSANHMRRAAALFRTQGLEVVPVPCNFLTNVSTAPPPVGAGVPGWEGFVKVSAWMHEQIGWIEYRRRGWISAEAARTRN